MSSHLPLVLSSLAICLFGIYVHNKNKKIAEKKLQEEMDRKQVSENLEKSMRVEKDMEKYPVLSNNTKNVTFMKINHLDEFLSAENISYVDNPLLQRSWPVSKSFVARDEHVIGSQLVNALDENEDPILYEFVRTGARKQIFFDGSKVKAAIVTCGGLCPGLNTVIREIVMALTKSYGCNEVYGIFEGYRGFFTNEIRALTPQNVSLIHHEGGTILSSSRGGFDLDKIIDAIKKKGINQLYIIGGDGTHRGALKIAEECIRLKLKITVSAIPKTIDNDIAYIDQSFGFATSVQEAILPINCAAVEAMGAPNGIGLIKLMGRNSGFIALHATLAARRVDACLIPEMKFTVLELCKHIENCLNKNESCIVVTAEGAGQDLTGEVAGKDASGNAIFADIGLFLKDEINKYFKKINKEVNLKYIDPTYMIRSVPANSADSHMCSRLAYSSVHAAMAGFTNFSVGLIDGNYVLLPIACIAHHETVKVDVLGREYARLCEMTGQNTLGGMVPENIKNVKKN